ncbi:unnamed protein product [Blepharisma stoltei]|uniref:Uncharacterized protein n=1 Tax=Blepharisma stoltei TaxID=1481888 RepID=A0AAU9I587_9CILI|nr:unnamed protein product [Blepharisma stoltei]
MSLSYYDQHLAWQQRVYKELSAATKYHTFDDDQKMKSYSNSSHSHKRARSKYSRESKITTDTLKEELLKSWSHDYRATNVYAEVRGKYARPPPPLAKPPSAMSMLNPQENKLISRPATAGSLRPRSQQRESVKILPQDDSPRKIEDDRNNGKGNLRPKSQQREYKRFNEETSSVKNKIDEDRKSVASDIISVRSKARSTRSYSSKRGESPDKSPLQKRENYEHVKENTDVVNEEKEEIVNEEGEVVENEAENKEEGAEKSEQDVISVHSFVTTSSQKRYIEELEDLLRQEKLRRIRAEEQLEKVSSRASQRRH